MLELSDYIALKSKIINRGFAEQLKFVEQRLEAPCDNADSFALEHAWVVLNSGMKYQIALKIYSGVIEALYNEIPLRFLFKHEGKRNAIEKIYYNRDVHFEKYQNISDKVFYLSSLPWIGEVTKFHLARNLGVNTVKPDRHLVRISNLFDVEPAYLCQDLSNKTGEKVGVVDFVLWSAGNQGLI
jgi:hypothetical protein